MISPAMLGTFSKPKWKIQLKTAKISKILSRRTSYWFYSPFSFSSVTSLGVALASEQSKILNLLYKQNVKRNMIMGIKSSNIKIYINVMWSMTIKAIIF